MTETYRIHHHNSMGKHGVPIGVNLSITPSQQQEAQCIGVMYRHSTRILNTGWCIMNSWVMQVSDGVSPGPACSVPA